MGRCHLQRSFEQVWSHEIYVRVLLHYGVFEEIAWWPFWMCPPCLETNPFLQHALFYKFCILKFQWYCHFLNMVYVKYKGHLYVECPEGVRGNGVVTPAIFKIDTGWGELWASRLGHFVPGEGWGAANWVRGRMILYTDIATDWCHGWDGTAFRQQYRWTISEAVNTVQCSWWWAKISPETCRAD